MTRAQGAGIVQYAARMTHKAQVLTIDQEKFCLAYIRLGDAKKSYAEVRPHVKPMNAKRMANTWLNNPNVASRIAELREQLVEKEKLTIEDMVLEFQKDRDAARIAGQFSSAVKANEAIAKLLGLWVDKNETTHVMRPEDARALVSQMVAKYLPETIQ